MTPLSLVKEIFSRPAAELEDKEEVWPAQKVRSILHRLSIVRARVNSSKQTVEVEEALSLSPIMLEITRTELSDSCRLSMCREGKKIRLQVGGWTFEADAPLRP